MLRIEKHSDFLLCFDSDGTVMDTMTSKHETCFGPDFLKVFGITHGKEDILRHWLSVNLYEKTRGINRFQGLAEILGYAEKKGYSFPGKEGFEAWVASTSSLSEQSLETECEKHPENETMKKALQWSKEVNRDIASMPPAKPFEKAYGVLQALSKDFDLLGVSSANPAAVKEEWDRLGFSPLFRFVACQDVGTKSDIIRAALESGYRKDHVIMVGDALGDSEASKRNGVYFYPILPGKENESWASLIEEAARPLREGRYDSSLQDAFDSRFQKALTKGN